MNAGTVDYTRDIKPVLKARCYACHGVLQQKAGLRLDTGAAALRGGKHGPIIRPEQPDQSPLLIRLVAKDLEERMPPEGEPLSSTQIAAFRQWIDSGASVPTDEKPETDPKDHWAFRPPVKAALPQHGALDPHGSSSNPIDAWVFSRHASEGLQSLGEAPKSVLLRRAYLDLVGYPPTRDEVKSFLLDDSIDAYEKTVDRLLQSPAHGERWARHWMDIWRYSDWYGRRQVPDVWNSAPQVWRWRDWIVRSLNADHGYDRMVAEMLAGDEISPEDQGARAATGYLVRNWYALNKNQWMRDVVEHTGKAFLGLTFNCAHCHDHKYDPIRHEDYFRFRAFFEPIEARQDWVQGEPDPGPFQKYDYSVLRRVVPHGIVSVFDENLSAKTYIYLRGDERSFPEGKPTVDPALPRFLQRDPLKLNEVEIPWTASYPGANNFIREAEVSKRVKALEEATQAASQAEVKLRETRDGFSPTLPLADRAKAFATWLSAETNARHRSNLLAVAQADLESIRSRIAADHTARAAKLNSSEIQSASQAAMASEKHLALRKAEAEWSEAESALQLLEAELAMAATRRDSTQQAETKEQKEKSDALRKKASDNVATKRKYLDSLPESLKTNIVKHTPLTPVYPARSTGRRTALARWMASGENPLTARVAVNHIWARHFHVPLVASTYDFGRNGAAPTNPELLDWLASDFVEHGWSMKRLHRLIVTSQTYRQATSPAGNEVLAGRFSSNRQRDPENKHLWRMHSGQMEAEVLRDSLLHLAGELDPKPVGYPIPNSQAETNRNRSLYFECFPEPNGQSAFAELFDAPNPNECYRRSQTIVPQQALALSNSRLALDQSRHLARKLAGKVPASEWAPHAWEHILARSPTASELAAAREFLSSAPKPETALASFVHALFNHHEFVTIR